MITIYIHLVIFYLTVHRHNDLCCHMLTLLMIFQQGNVQICIFAATSYCWKILVLWYCLCRAQHFMAYQVCVTYSPICFSYIYLLMTNKPNDMKCKCHLATCYLCYVSVNEIILSFTEKLYYYIIIILLHF